MAQCACGKTKAEDGSCDGSHKEKCDDKEKKA